MRTFTDDELQQWLEEGHTTPPGDAPAEAEAELQAYAQLFSELSAPPPGSLPPGFATRITAQVMQQEVSRSDRKLFTGIAAMLLLVAGAAIVYVLGMNASFSNSWLGALPRLKWPLLFGVMVLAMVQVLDRKLVGRVSR